MEAWQDQARLGGRRACRRLRRNLDRAGPGNRRGGDHPRRAAVLRSAARAEVVEEDTCRRPDCDNRGDYDRSQVAAQIFALPIHRPSRQSIAYRVLAAGCR
jgi:hypothetical protein